MTREEFERIEFSGGMGFTVKEPFPQMGDREFPLISIDFENGRCYNRTNQYVELCDVIRFFHRDGSPLTMKKLKPKPCPFCGGTAVFAPYSTESVTIRCSDEECCTFPTMKDEETAIKAWNKRI